MHLTCREHGDSVVECLTQDQGVAGLSLTGGPVALRCVLEQDTFIAAYTAYT